MSITFFNYQCCLLLKNKRLQLRITTLLQKGFYCTQYCLVWTEVVPLTLHWSKVAWLCSSPQLTWPHGLFLINHSPSLSLSLILWRSVFEYCVQVFPCVHTLEDGAQAAHPIIFPDNQVFLFLYLLYWIKKIKKSFLLLLQLPRWWEIQVGVFRLFKFCYLVSHPTFCRFFSVLRLIILWFLQQAFRSFVDPTYHSLCTSHITM